MGNTPNIFQANISSLCVNIDDPHMGEYLVKPCFNHFATIAELHLIQRYYSLSVTCGILEFYLYVIF